MLIFIYISSLQIEFLIVLNLYRSAYLKKTK